jgi:hypothetical protein
MNGDIISLLGIDDVSRSCNCGNFSFFAKVQEKITKIGNLIDYII